MVTGRGYMDINRISGYIPGKLVQFLMQVNPWAGHLPYREAATIEPGSWMSDVLRTIIGIMNPRVFDIRFVPQVAGATSSLSIVH